MLQNLEFTKIGICVMMSNSTLPLGFLHSNTELVTCGQLLLYLDIAFAVELLFICSASGCDKVDKLHNLTAHLSSDSLDGL